jgi:Protein of unknown function (DUF1552)
MFLSKKHLSRRAVLRGLGAGVALPLLDAMVPAGTALAQTAAKPVQRFGTFYVPHGAIMSQWMPKGTGTQFEFSRILKPLEPLRAHVNVITGLYSEGPNVHSPTPGFLFAGAHAARATSEYRLNTTIDQVIAEHIGQETVFPSMEFAIEDSSNLFGTCAGDYLCLYMDSISWRTPTQPLPMEINPRIVFERMFGGDGTTAEARRIRLEQTTSILDAVADDVHGLRATLGAPDRSRLDEYLENVREVERRIVMAEEQRSERKLDAPPTPSGVPESFEEHVGLMFELQALAFQGDLTRVTSFMMGRELSGLSFPQIGVADGHHPVSHNEYDPAQMEKKAKIDTYQVHLFARYLERLRNTPDGDGSLLDHSLFIYGSGMSNGNRHDHLNLPVLVAGHAGGQLAGGRHFKVGDELPPEERDYKVVPKFSRQTPIANLMVTALNLMGVEADSYGIDICKSTGALDLS